MAGLTARAAARKGGFSLLIAGLASVVAGLFFATGAGATTISISGSMEGALGIQAGDWIAGGYHFKPSGSSGSYYFSGARIELPVACSSGGAVAGTIVVPLQPGPWAVSGSGWIPWNNQSDPGSYQGAIQAPDLCSGGVMYNNASTGGATFTADVSGTSNTSDISVQFHYRDPNAKGKGNHNCFDPTDPKAGDAATCGASVSSTNVVTPSTTTTVPGATTTTVPGATTTTTVPGSTTTTAPGNTTTTVASSTTVQQTTTTVCTTTTTAPGTSATSASQCAAPATVAGEVITRAPAAGTLPRTGVSRFRTEMLLAGLTLVIGGIVLLSGDGQLKSAISRRR